MQNSQSAIKFMRQTKKRTVKNMAIKSTIKTTVKKLRDVIDSKQDATQFLNNAFRVIDKGVSKSILKRNTANRKKARLSLLVNKAAKS